MANDLKGPSNVCEKFSRGQQIGTNACVGEKKYSMEARKNLNLLFYVNLNSVFGCVETTFDKPRVNVYVRRLDGKRLW
ncbi:MAG: hypothetical protein HHJ16_09170 [Polaromonas sp.]|uniref:hypothetical protein n=1 Tax=Polaromonas sp. TaxID=1869339 RepID=UPI00180DF9A3|nr:hypothetical protein [Polaromonas sp.]NMM10431.1 hypothetical protein [Polaromonas sp.]